MGNDVPDPPVPRDGLSLAALRSFADAHAAKEYRVQTESKAWVMLPFSALTTAQVCEVVVKPATEARDGSAGCAYAEVLRGKDDERGVPSVAPATRIDSHAWGYVGADLLGALLAHCDDPAADTEHYWVGTP